MQDDFCIQVGQDGRTSTACLQGDALSAAKENEGEYLQGKVLENGHFPNPSFSD